MLEVSYKTLSVGASEWSTEAFDDKLTALGRKGWEVVQVLSMPAPRIQLAVLLKLVQAVKS